MPEATAIVQQVDLATAVARALAEGATGHLRLSYVRTIPGGLPERIVREYRRRFPRVDLSADSGSTGANVARLLAGELDVAFVHPPLEHAAKLGCVDISIEPLVVAIPSAGAGASGATSLPACPWCTSPVPTAPPSTTRV